MYNLEVKNIAAYTHKKTVFENISFNIKPGMIYGLLGHNGSGKSTIQRLLANFEVPMRGEILIGGVKNDINIHNKDVVLVPDTVRLIMNQSIKQNFNVITKHYDVDVEYFNKCIKALRLEQNDVINELSKGNQEIVQLAIYFSINTKVYLLDEPFSAVDIYRRDFIQKLIIDLIVRNPKSSVIVTTHLIDEISNSLNHIIYLDEGEIIIDEDIDVLCSEHGSLSMFLRDYFKEEVGYEEFI